MSTFTYSDSAAGLSADDLAPFFVGWPDPPLPARRLVIVQAASEVIVARDESGAVVGFVTAVTDGMFAAFVSLLEVAPGAQRRGVGSELVRRMLARLDGHYSIDLVCDDDVVPFYEQIGGHRLTGFGWRNRRRL